MRYSLKTSLLILLIIPLLSDAQDVMVDIDVLVKTGDASPDGNGVFANTSLSAPMLNNQGEVLVHSGLVATTDPTMIDDFGFYRLSRQGNILLTRGGEDSAFGDALNLSPNLLTNLGRFSQQGLADDGSMRFIIPTNLGDVALYRADNNGLTVILQDGQVTSFSDELELSSNFFEANDAGQSGFGASVSGFFLGATDDSNERLFVGLGDALPNGREATGLPLATFTSGMNNQGQIALPVATNSPVPNNAGLYLTDGVNISQILHLGEPAVDGLGSYFGQVGNSSISDIGTALVAQFVDDITTDYIGLFFFDGTNLQEWLRTGDLVENQGPVMTINGSMYINSNETGLFSGRFVANGGSPESIFHHRNGVNSRIISDFDQIPEPVDLPIRGPFSYALNAQDQVLIFGGVIAEGVTRQAILLYDPDDGFALVARVGMPFRDSIIAGLDMSLPATSGIMNIHNTNATNGFNDQGEIAFSYLLQNGELGAAIATIEFVDESFLFADGFED